MFSKKYKISKKNDFNLIYKKGTLFQSDCLKVFILPNNLDYSRFSIIVSKAVSSRAVDRNKVKRRLKNIFFNFNVEIAPSVDIIVKTQPGINKIETVILKEKFENLFKKINCIKS